MDYFEEIESYLNNELLPEERQEFETELAKNADLRRDVAEYRLLFELMRGSKEPQYDAEHERLRNVVLKAHGLPVTTQKKTDVVPVKIIPIVQPDDVEPEKEENTEGGKIIALQPSPLKPMVKKTWIRWAAAASVALVVAASMWFSKKEPMQTPPQIAVQTPPPIDTLKKIDVPKSENAVVEVPKETPQYPKQKEVKKENLQGNAPHLPNNSVEKVEQLETNEQVYAAVETALDKISVETKGNNTDDVIKALRSRNADKAIELSENQMTMDYLKERREFYLALAYLLKNKKEGIARLKAIENTDGHKFKQNAIELLKRLE